MEMESRMKSVMKEDSAKGRSKEYFFQSYKVAKKYFSCIYSSEIFYKILSSSFLSLSIHFMLCF